MRIEDDRGLSNLLRSSEEQKLCDGFRFTEGPVWVAADNALLFSDIPGNRMYRWRPGGTTEVYREPSGWANGLTLDHAGNVLACEHGGRRVSRAAYAAPYEMTAVAAEWDGVPLNSPNDLVVHSSGAIFFTDPTYGADTGRTPRQGAEGQQPLLPFRGVYRIDPDGALQLLVREGFEQPNGLAFTPDESALYIGDSRGRVVWRYEVHSDLSLGERVLFVDQRDDPRPGGPDGMKLDTEGRLWTTGAGGISVFTPDGACLGTIALEEHPANLAFGGEGGSALFVTCGSSVVSIETKVMGIGPGIG